jgi:outer membrane protein TolC
MMGRPTWPLMLIAAWLIPWVEPAPCAGQSPTPPTEAAGPTPGARRPASLPSTVSPAIERFMSRRSRDLPPPPPPTIPATAEVRRQEPSPMPPWTATPAALPGQGQAIWDRSPALPSGAPTSRAPQLGGAMMLRPSPLAAQPNLGRAPTEPADLRFPINLATALRLSDARPIIVAAAQAGVWAAEADLQKARVLWVPDLDIAADYLRHDGGGPDFNKGVMTAPSVNFFYAGGGLIGFIATTDALFQPLVARQVLNARHWDVQTAKNDALMRTADAYFRVHQYRGTYAGTLYCIKRGDELVERLATMSHDLVQEFEVERARNMVADLRQRAVTARQQWRVASADLTQVLRLDPRAVVEPLEHDHLQVTLIEPGRTLEDLMPIALTNRPELASRQAMVQSAIAAIRREKARPLLPNVAINGFQTPYEMIQAGIFGLGVNNKMNQWQGRDDVSIQPVWQLQNIGLGNLALIKRQRALESRAIVDLFEAQDMVAADVTRALARVQSAALRVVQADRALRTGIITLNGTFEGLQQTSRFGNVLVLITRPQEAVYALDLLRVAFEEYFNTVAEYNKAQFELFHALGYPAQEVALEHPTGEIRPVDLARPNFLPPVGNGPPPATR